jgi:hypothetical protein
MLVEIVEAGGYGSGRRAKELFNNPAALFRWISAGRGQARIILDVREPLPDSRVLPTDPRSFFSHISSRYFGCKWREVDGVIELAVPEPRIGYSVGRGGAKIRAIEAHLGRRVKLVPARWVSIPFGTYPDQEILIEPYRDPSRGFAPSGAFVAPWHQI